MNTRGYSNWQIMLDQKRQLIKKAGKKVGNNFIKKQGEVLSVLQEMFSK